MERETLYRLCGPGERRPKVELYPVCDKLGVPRSLPIRESLRLHAWVGDVRRGQVRLYPGAVTTDYTAWVDRLLEEDVKARREGDELGAAREFYLHTYPGWGRVCNLP